MKAMGTLLSLLPNYAQTLQRGKRFDYDFIYEQNKDKNTLKVMV